MNYDHSLNAISLTERWKAHSISQKTDLRAKLIDACSKHQGWEESAVAMVDEAIMPVIRTHKPAPVPDVVVCPNCGDLVSTLPDDELPSFEDVRGIMGDASTRKDEVPDTDQAVSKPSPANVARCEMLDNLTATEEEVLATMYDAVGNLQYADIADVCFKAIRPYLRTTEPQTSWEAIAGIRMESIKALQKELDALRSTEPVSVSLEKCTAAAAALWTNWETHTARTPTPREITKAVLNAAGVAWK